MLAPTAKAEQRRIAGKRKVKLASSWLLGSGDVPERSARGWVVEERVLRRLHRTPRRESQLFAVLIFSSHGGFTVPRLLYSTNAMKGTPFTQRDQKIFFLFRNPNYNSDTAGANP